MNQKQIRFVLLCLAVTSIVFIGLGMWAIDIGVSGMVNDLPCTNGFFTRDSIQQYHIGLWMVGISSVLMTMILICTISFGTFNVREEK